MEVKAMEEMEEEEAVEEMEEEILEVLVKAKISPSMSKNELLTSRSLLTFWLTILRVDFESLADLTDESMWCDDPVDYRHINF